MSFYIVSDDILTSIANTIRNRSGNNEQITFPQGFIEEINTLSTDYEIWNGNYNIIPSVNSQSLDTKGKAMRDNITINQIPYYEVSNNFVNTVYIGGDLNG